MSLGWITSKPPAFEIWCQMSLRPWWKQFSLLEKTLTGLNRPKKGETLPETSDKTIRFRDNPKILRTRLAPAQFSSLQRNQQKLD
jgi:hypothetical protein